MAAAADDSTRRDRASSAFVNAARDFVNRVRALPGLRIWAAASIVAVLVFTAAGAFSTGGLPVGWRLLFWSALIGLNTMLWLAWFALTVRKPTDWWRSSFVGAPLLNLLMPLEVVGLLKLVGARVPERWPLIWIDAAALSGALLLLLFVSVQRRTAREPPLFAKGRLWRAGFRTGSEVAAIAAEDHYCRVFRGDGSSVLLHARFADLVEELGQEDGTVVRRGHWIAASAVGAVERSARRWVIALKDGRAVPVSSGALADLKARGWIASGSAPTR